MSWKIISNSDCCEWKHPGRPKWEYQTDRGMSTFYGCGYTCHQQDCPVRMLTEAEADKLVNEIIQIINMEPEYPGDIPHHLKDFLERAIQNHDMDLIVQALRTTVHLTKKGIIDRIQSIIKF